MVGVGGAWPFVGRAEELERLLAALDAGVPVCALRGATGMGKTVLVRELVVRHGGPAEVVVGSVGGGSIPFAPVVHLLPEPAPELDLADLLWRAIAAFRQRAGARMLVVVDDAHALDEASAALIHHLSGEGLCQLVLAYRSGEALRGPLAQLVADCSGSATVDLAPLSADDARLAAEVGLGGQLDDAVAQRIVDLAQGHPLLLHELVVGAVESGGLRAVDGVWVPGGSLAASSRLTAVVERRLAGLADAERDALETVVLGEPVDLDLLLTLVAGEAVETLEQRGLVRIEQLGGRSTVIAGHAVYSEVLRETMPELRRRRVLSRLADGLTAAGNEGGIELVRAAVWRLDAGEPVGPDLLVPAARQAARLFDPALAARLARLAVDQSPSFEALMVLADALVAQRLDAESDAVFQAALDAATTVDEAISGVTQYAFVLTWRRHDPEEALAVLSATEDLVSDQHAKILAAQRTNVLVAHNRLDEVVDLAGGLLGSGGEMPGQAELLARTSLSLAWALTGKPHRALAEACTAEHVLPQHLDTVAGQIAAFALPYGRQIALLSLGRLDAADEQAAAQLAIGEALDARLLIAYWLTLIGNLGTIRGHAHTARARLERAVAVLGDTDVLGLLPLALASLAHAAAVTGDLRTAQAVAARARQTVGSSVLAAAVQPALAWVDACAGRLDAAVATSLAAARDARQAGQVLLEVRPLQDAARFAAADRVVGRLRELARGAEGDWIPLARDHAECLVGRDPVALEALVDRFVALGDRVTAAECAATSASWFAAAGDDADSIRARRRATQLLAGLEPLSTPALEAEVVARLRPVLTRRETEVALLASQRLSTRAIAERLHVSMRTAENHLHRIYGKLGVSGKAELSRRLHH